MTWYYWKFPRHPVAEEKFEMRGRNTILFHSRYRVYPELGKVVRAIFRIQCVCSVCVDQLDKDWLPVISPLSQPRYARVENCY